MRISPINNNSRNVNFKSKISISEPYLKEDLCNGLYSDKLSDNFYSYYRNKDNNPSLYMDKMREFVKNLETFAHDGSDNEYQMWHLWCSGIFGIDKNGSPKYTNNHYSSAVNSAVYLGQFLEKTMPKVNLKDLFPYERAALENKIHNPNDLLKVNDIILEANNERYKELISECVL